jgi:hypothetical protein
MRQFLLPPLLQDEISDSAQPLPSKKTILWRLECALRFIVQVRHPNVLALRDTIEVEEKGLTSIYIITEPVTPLIDVLEELDVAGPARWCGTHGIYFEKESAKCPYATSHGRHILLQGGVHSDGFVPYCKSCGLP